MTPLPQIAFFLSGFAALLYQVIWQRLLVIFSGADVFSLTIIVVAFMGGLGVGGLVGGRLADRLGSRASLWAFAIAELLVGAFGLISKPLYYDVLYETFPELAATPGIAAAVLIASLLWPTFLMGLSLPLLARALTASLEAAGRVIGSLYGWNTLGAATGAWVSTWLLLPRFGLERSLWIGSAANLVCAVLAALLAWRGAAIDRTERATPDRDALDSPAPQDEPWSFRGWVLIAGLAGFVALAHPRVEHRIGDGRAYIVHTSRLFDIIEADALRPTSAYAGNLYSREYFEVLRRHLKPGGLAVTWAPTERIARTFLSVFPHVLAFGDIVIGSNAPISFDPAVIAARAAAVSHYYDAAGIDIIAILRPYIESVPRSFGPADSRTLIDVNTDTFPRDEFALPF